MRSSTVKGREFFYIEFRRPIGFDAELLNLDYAIDEQTNDYIWKEIGGRENLPLSTYDGVMIRLTKEDPFGRKQTHLIDGSPHADDKIFRQYDNKDIVFRVGQVFFDPKSQISIKVLNISDEKAEVLVDVLTECNDGFDNDRDGKVDYPNDSDCTSKFGNSELPECQNNKDDDEDGFIDYPNDRNCESEFDSERLECYNEVDDDNDGLTDYPEDPDCINYYSSETWNLLQLFFHIIWVYNN